MVCYNENSVHKIIELTQPQRVAYIKHDDKEPNHYHIFLYRKSPYTEQTLTAVCAAVKALFQENVFFEFVVSINGMLEYFTHKNQPEKKQYDVSSIVSNFDIEKEILYSEYTIIDAVNDIVNGESIYWIIRKNPKMLYSIYNLQRFEDLHKIEMYKQSNTIVTNPLKIDKMKDLLELNCINAVFNSMPAVPEPSPAN